MSTNAVLVKKKDRERTNILCLFLLVGNVFLKLSFRTQRLSAAGFLFVYLLLRSSPNLPKEKAGGDDGGRREKNAEDSKQTKADIHGDQHEDRMNPERSANDARLDDLPHYRNRRPQKDKSEADVIVTAKKHDPCPRQ